MRISVLSHAANRPRDMVNGFRACFEGQTEKPAEIIVVEQGIWNKCEMVNEAARQASGEWYFVSDIDNRYDDSVMPQLVRHCRSGHDATFFKNVIEMKGGYALDGAEGESKRRWAFTAVLVSADLWRRIGGFDTRYRRWGWMDLDFYQSCLKFGSVQVDSETPVISLWHPTWKIWAYNKLGEPQCFIDHRMLQQDMWLYRMTLPSSKAVVEKWKDSASSNLVDIFKAWDENRRVYESKWPEERERIRAKYLNQLSEDTY